MSALRTAQRTALQTALQELAEPLLAEDVRSGARERLPAGDPAPGSPSGRPRRDARAVREQRTAHAAEVVRVLDEAVALEVRRLSPLAAALDWLVDAAPERSLARELLALDPPEDVSRRVAEAAAALGALEAEALALAGAPAPPVAPAAVEALVRVRLARAACLVDRWIEENA